MYVRFIEITSASVTQFDMAVAWFKTEWSGLAIKGGAISYDMVKLSDNSGMIVVYWPDEKTAKNFGITEYHRKSFGICKDYPIKKI